MTEAELLAELENVNDAITAVLLAGKRYKTESGPSIRETEMPELKDLRAHRASILADIEALNGQAIVFSF